MLFAGLTICRSHVVLCMVRMMLIRFPVPSQNSPKLRQPSHNLVLLNLNLPHFLTSSLPVSLRSSSSMMSLGMRIMITLHPPMRESRSRSLRRLVSPTVRRRVLLSLVHLRN